MGQKKNKGIFGFHYLCKLRTAPASLNMVIPELPDTSVNKIAPSNTSSSSQAMTVTMR